MTLRISTVETAKRGNMGAAAGLSILSYLDRESWMEHPKTASFGAISNRERIVFTT